MRYAFGLDELIVLVHEQYPCFLNIEILHTRVHIIIDVCGRAQVGALFSFLPCPSLAQFAGGENGYGLCRTYSVVALQVVDAHLAQRVQVVMTVVEHLLHQVYGTLLCAARAYEYGQQFGVAEAEVSFFVGCWEKAKWGNFVMILKLGLQKETASDGKRVTKSGKEWEKGGKSTHFSGSSPDFGR